MDWKSFVYSVVTSTTLVAFAGFLAKAWLLERLRGSIKHEYDGQLESLKAGFREQSDRNLAQLSSEIARQTDKLRTAISSYTDVQRATIGRKVEAIDVLWQGHLKAAEAFPSSVSVTDILSDDEMKELWTSSKLKKFTAGISELNELEFFKVGLHEVQAVRPHIGEYAWAVYVTYRSVLGRSIYLIKEGRSEPSKVEWYKDQNIQSLVISALGQSAANDFIALGHSRFNWLNHHFTAKLLAAMNEILTGQAFSQATLAQTQKMDQQLAEQSLNRAKQ